jgi:sigma-B regulation protein RsbQ
VDLNPAPRPPITLNVPDALIRNNVTVTGPADAPAIVFSHGFGCDQSVWRDVAPALAAGHRIVLFDHVGAGGSDVTAYRRDRYASLHGYADDLRDVCEALGLSSATVVGHSVGATIAMLAAIEDPGLFGDLVLVAPNPRHTDDMDWVGGIRRDAVEDLLGALDSNYLGWARTMAPLAMGNEDRPALAEDLTASFCRADPEIAQQFARAAFLADHREDLPTVRARTLILQCREDPLAPAHVGEYMHRHIAGSRLINLDATGHCPHLSAPAETVAAIRTIVRAT